MQSTMAAEEFAPPQRPSTTTIHGQMEVSIMVAVKEFSWEEVSSSDFENPARRAWREAVAEIAAKVLAAALSHYPAGAERDHASAQIDQVAANILRNE